MMSDLIVVKNADHICQILFNRLQKKNAITAEMYQLMADAINVASSNASIKVIVLGSNNEHFTAGNDLADFLANPSIEKGSPVHQFLQALMHCPLPVIAAVQGFAIGIGSTLLLHCEQVFADKKHYFIFSVYKSWAGSRGRLITVAAAPCGLPESSGLTIAG
jgi:enoyl-CoA hydratase/carnithine racemase